MKKKAVFYFALAGVLFLFFAIFTVLVGSFDVKPIGPEGTAVGFSTLNGFVFRHIGVNWLWYDISEKLGLAAIAVMFVFAAVGLFQLVTRKSVRNVDRSLLVLGLFYGLMFVVYLLFEQIVLNYRPVILEEGLEASYPSSHTMLAVCVMTTAAMQIRSLFPNRKRVCLVAEIAAGLITVTLVLGRLFSGVHWFTDIVGALLLSAALVMTYRAAVELCGGSEWQK